MPSELLTINAAAGDPKPSKVRGLAYSGGLLKLPGWRYPIVVDLAGLDIASEVPLLLDHKNETPSRVGVVRASVEAGRRLHIEGEILEAISAEARATIAQGRAADWALSIGAEPLASQLVPEGKTIIANAQMFKGPIYLITKSRLREISVVPIGVDHTAALRIAAAWHFVGGVKAMSSDLLANSGETLADVKKGEEQRVETIEALVATYTAQNPDAEARLQPVAERAIRAGFTIQETELQLLRAARPTVPAYHARGGAGAFNARIGTASLLLRCGYAAAAEKHFGAETCEQADALHCDSLLELLSACVRMERGDVPRNKNELVRAAFSTQAATELLGDSIGRVVLTAYAETPATWESFSAVRDVADFRPQTAGRPSFGTPAEQVAPSGELKMATVEEETMPFSIGTYGKLLTISRADIVNDNVGIFQDAGAALGRSCRRALNDLFYSVLLSDAGTFFNASTHKNLLTSGSSALDIGSFGAAVQLLREQRDAQSNDLDIKPAALLVPPALEETARALISSTEVLPAEAGPTANAWANSVRVEIEPRLSNVTKYASASDKAWFVAASPADSPMIVGFLNGARVPTTEFFGVSSSAEVLGASWRCYLDFGVNFGDWRAFIRADGE
jgi:hypothetical protein